MAVSPLLLAESGRPKDLRPNGFNIAFRIGVEQADKLRACDDLRRSLANSACRVRTPIKLVSWGHVSQMCRSYAVDGRHCALFKADREAAYKQLPIDPADQSCAIIALRNPTTGKWHGFRSRTFMFGSVADVLRYNVSSRPITAIFNRMFGIPPICFFGDFADLIHRLLATEGLSVFSRFRPLLGIKLKGAKSEVGPAIAFSVLLGSFPSKENGAVLPICMPDEKSRALAALIRSYLAQNRLSYQEIEKLIGRLSFSQTLLFGKFARTQLRPLYTKMRRKYFCASLSAQERATIVWWDEVISGFPPRICRPLSSRFDDLLYTGAATNPPCICALLPNPNSSGVRLSTLLVAFVRPWIHLFKATCLIFGLELLALLAFSMISPRCSPGDQYGSTWTTIIVRRMLRGAILTRRLSIFSFSGAGIPANAATFMFGFPEFTQRETRRTCPRGRNGFRFNRGSRPHLDRFPPCLDWAARN